MKDAYLLLLNTSEAKTFTTEDTNSTFSLAFTQAIIKTYHLSNLSNPVDAPGFIASNHCLRHEETGNQYVTDPGFVPGWFNGSAVLPLYKLELKGKTGQNKSYLDWEIIAHEQVTDQVLEVSSDGKLFTTLMSLTNTARSFIYRPISASIIQYRLRVSFDNGSTYYSNILLLSAGDNELRPALAGKLVSNNMIMVKSPGRYTWSICDTNGDEVRKGELAMGTNLIYIPGIKTGIYTIRFAGQDKEWSEMIVSE